MTESTEPGSAIVHQVYGPPGTGKTRYLTEKVREVVRTHGADSLVIASFSVTAAKEIASRGLGLPDRAVGTLHSHAFRGLRGGETVVALDPKVLVDWNTHAGQQWKITPDTRRGIPESATEGGGYSVKGMPTGDDLISALDKARSTFVDPADYPPDLAAFAKEWTEWKNANGAVDYTDMIELALERARDGETAPGNPLVFVVDEGQDNTPLEVSLILEWGKRAASVVVALDDDQAINEWRGGDPRRMLTLGQDNDGYAVDRHVLGKSYRIPAAVHRIAEQWVRRLTLRQPKRYDPRTTDREGNELADPPMGAAFCVPESITHPALADKIEQDVEDGRSVMVIASCTYMLTSLIARLKDRGLPFHNPFRPTEPRWNPLGSPRGRGLSTVERIYRFLVMREDAENRLWTGRDIQAWLPLLRSDAGLVRGAKQLVETLPTGEVPFEQVVELFSDHDALASATESDLEWFAASVLGSKQKSTAYPIQVVRQRGPQALKNTPQVTLGTIHSVKGGASDIVYLAPDMSTAGMANLKTVSGRDQMIRLFYVAMTRAYEELRLLAPMSSRNFIHRRSLLPAELEVPA